MKSSTCAKTSGNLESSKLYLHDQGQYSGDSDIASSQTSSSVKSAMCLFFFFLATFDVNGVSVNGRGKGGKLFLISIQ